MKKENDQKNNRHQNRHNKNRQHQAEVFPQQKFPAVNRFSQQGEDSFLVNFLIDQPGAHQNGHQHPEKRNRSQPYIFYNFNPVTNGQQAQKT